MEAISVSGRFHPSPAIVPAAAPRPVRIARAGDVHCACCKRAPLVGESVILHVRPDSEAWACELCERSTETVTPLGEPHDSVRVLPGRAEAVLPRAA
jgi:hypothetical protein